MTTATGSTMVSPSLAGLAARGALGGAVAGAVFGAANMWYADSTGMPAQMPLQMIATIVQGEGALADGSANAWLGLGVHMVLSVGFGIGLALVASRLAGDAARAALGLVYGLGLYLVNFLVISPIAFGVFQDANQPFEAVVHVVFGAIAVLFLLDYRSARPVRSARSA